MFSLWSHIVFAVSYFHCCCSKKKTHGERIKKKHRETNNSGIWSWFFSRKEWIGGGCVGDWLLFVLCLLQFGRQKCQKKIGKFECSIRIWWFFLLEIVRLLCLSYDHEPIYSSPDTTPSKCAIKNAHISQNSARFVVTAFSIWQHFRHVFVIRALAYWWIFTTLLSFCCPYIYSLARSRLWSVFCCRNSNQWCIFLNLTFSDYMITALAVCCTTYKFICIRGVCACCLVCNGFCFFGTTWFLRLWELPQSAISASPGLSSLAMS